MPTYVPPDVTIDPLVMQANAKRFLEEELPGWHSSPGSIEDLLIDAFSYSASEQAEALRAELVAAYRAIGALVGVQAITATPAIGTATFTVADAGGHTLLASGTIIGLRTSSNELQTFRLANDLAIEVGQTTGAGLVEATEAGTEGNGLGGTAELVSADAVVLSATVATTGGGEDEEEEQAFLQRLTEELAIQRPGPVLAVDAALIARTIPGVYRATAIDNLKPSTEDGGEGAEETNVEKCVTVAIAKADGTAATPQIAEVLALLSSEREVNFKFFVVAPHYTEVDVLVTVSAWPGFALATVKAEAEAAIESALSPARWGADAGGNAQVWTNNPTIRPSDIYAALSTVRGVRWAQPPSFAKHGDPLSTASLLLSGSAVPVLPIPATISVNVEPS